MKYFVALALLGACTMQDYYPNAEITQIDGVDFFVASTPGAGGAVYLAGPNEPEFESLFVNNLPLARLNVRAIEQVTGCKVDPVSIKNIDTGTTFAAVICGG